MSWPVVGKAEATARRELQLCDFTIISHDQSRAFYFGARSIRHVAIPASGVSSAYSRCSSRVNCHSRLLDCSEDSSRLVLSGVDYLLVERRAFPRGVSLLRAVCRNRLSAVTHFAKSNEVFQRVTLVD